jgi:Flp pilus assembly protein CpaB
MAKNTVPIIIGAVLFGLLAIGLTFYVLTGSNNGGPAPDAPTGTAGTAATAATPAPSSGTSYVAARTIYPRTLITRDMLIESNNSSATAGAITDPNAIVGRLANRIIRAGQPLTADSVTNSVARVIPANIAIPIGLRGVAIWVDPDQTAAGLVDVGDRVDVIATHDLKAEKQTDQAVVGSTEFTAGRTIVQDVEVLAVDRSIAQFQPEAVPTPVPAPVAPGQPAPPAGQPAPAPTPAQPAAGSDQTNAQQPNAAHNIRVIVAAAPADAQRLVAANKKGQLHITIRNPGSHERLVSAEAREYPSRLVNLGTADRVRREKLQDEARARSYARQEKAFEYQTQKELTAMKLPPMIPAPNRISSGGPMPSNSKEVTVIRGTEKTRVVVPR